MTYTKPQPPTMEEIQDAVTGLILAHNENDMTYLQPEYLPIIIDWLINIGGITEQTFDPITNNIDSCVIKFSDAQYLQFWGW